MTGITAPFSCRSGTVTGLNCELTHINAVPLEFLIAGFQRYGSGWVLIPAGILIIALQLIPHLDNRK